MSFFKHHVFFCTNQRENGEVSCATHGAADLQAYAKARTKDLDYRDVRINRAGCLGRCLEGPVMVVYPEATWYTFVDKEDIDEILDRHIGKGEIVDRLKI